MMSMSATGSSRIVVVAVVIVVARASSARPSPVVVAVGSSVIVLRTSTGGGGMASASAGSSSSAVRATRRSTTSVARVCWRGCRCGAGPRVGLGACVHLRRGPRAMRSVFGRRPLATIIFVVAVLVEYVVLLSGVP